MNFKNTLVVLRSVEIFADGESQLKTLWIIMNGGKPFNSLLPYKSV